MSFFRDNSRLSDRLKGKTTDEIINEIRSDFDKDRGSFFDRPSTNRTRSRFGPSADQFFSRTSFDDDLPRRGSPHRADLRSHLDDLARRHPDIADQLRGFPTAGEPNYTSGSADRTATEAGAPEPRQNQDSSSQTQGSQDGAGFKEDSKIGNLQNHGLRNTVPLVDPARSSTSHSSAAHNSMNSQDSQGARSPRAQSAPPTAADESGQQRFVSKIEIQPNGSQASQETGDGYTSEAPQHGQNENQAPPQHPGQPHNNYNNQQPHQQQQDTSKAHVKQPNVRHIPIFVEGRDAPIVNRDHEPPPSFHHQEAPAAHHPRYREPIFEPVFSAANSVPVDRPFGGAHHSPGGAGFDIPIQTERGGFRPNQFGGAGFSKPQQQPRPAPSEKVHRVFTQQPEPAHPPARAPHPPHPDATDSAAHPSPAAPSPPPKKISRPKTALEVIQEVQAEVDKLKAEIDKYKGTSRLDKEYIYLDEMLTRELLKLDNVETGGVEEIRNLRKQTIKNIQATIAALEAKVPSTPAGAANDVVPSPGGGDNESAATGESEVGESQGHAAVVANASPMEVDATKSEGAENKGEGGEAKADSGEGKTAGGEGKVGSGDGNSSGEAPAQPAATENK